MSLCDGGTHSTSVWSHCSGHTGRGIEVVSSSIPLSTREQPVSLELSSSMSLLARLLPVAFFFVCLFQSCLLLVGLHGFSSQRLHLLPPEAVWHSSQQSHPAFGAVIACLHRIQPQWQCLFIDSQVSRVEQGVCPEHFTQSFIEIGEGGGVSCTFCIIAVMLDILVGFLTLARSPCRKALRSNPGFLAFSDIEIPIRSRLWHRFSCPSFYI